MKTIAPYASVTYNFPWEPAFLLVGGQEGVTDQERLLKTGRRSGGLRCLPPVVSAIPPSFPIYPEKVCLAKVVHGESNCSGRRDVSFNVERLIRQIKEPHWEFPTRQLTPAGPIRELCLGRRAPKSFVAFTSEFQALILLPRTLS